MAASSPKRPPGLSIFLAFGRLARTAVDGARLWVELVVLGRHRARPEDLGFRFRWPFAADAKPDVVDRL